jgi:hypothetical protein
MTIAVNGLAPQLVVNLAQDTPMSVAPDGTNVYFLDVAATNSIVSVPVVGGSPQTLTSTDTAAANISGTAGPTVAIDSSHVYWLNPPQIVKLPK